MDRQTKSMLAFGEVLFDLIEDEAHLGGASLNVAAHFAKHGNEVVLVSAIGDDSLGAEAKAIARSYGISTDLFQVNASPTGTVKVTLSEQGQPSYDIVESVAWDAIILQESDLDFIRQRNWDCFYFGMLAQRSTQNRISLERILEAGSFGTIFCDVNLRKDYFSEALLRKSLQQCTILKLNDEEVEVLSPMLFQDKYSVEKFAERCAEEFSIDVVIITLGAEGAGVYAKGVYQQVPGIQVQVADTVGAGDSFSAAFLNAYLKGESTIEAVAAGCKLGAYVASKHGAVPAYRNE